MSLATTFAAICDGQRPGDHTLLGTCRLEWGGAEAFGEEAILESFRRAPLDFETGTLLNCPGAALWTSAGSALAADLYDGHVGRLWRLGNGCGPRHEPALWVPFETDLRQERARLLWRPEDHPWLASGDVARAAALAEKLVAPKPELHRMRGFVLRAFSAKENIALLVCQYRLTAGDTRATSFRLVAAVAGTVDELVVEDAEPEAQWVMQL